MDRLARLEPLGLQRNRVMACLGADMPEALNYFPLPPDDADIFDAFGSYIGELSKRWATETDWLTVSLLAAGRFLIGDLTAADLILDRLPVEPVELDHGAGFCVMAAIYALAAALPLPPNLKDTKRWVQGSAEQAALRAWLAGNRHKLRWVEREGVYRNVG